MRPRQILTCLFLLTLIPLNVKAFPPASPAGGNYLVLDGDDDHAVLDFETFGMLFPEGTDEFTVEAWVYPTTPPNKNTALTILSQQVRMRVVSDESHLLNTALNIDPPKGDLILIMDAQFAGKGPHVTTRFLAIPLVPNQWNYIVFQSDGHQTTMIVNDFVEIMLHGIPLGHELALRPKDFVLGGFGKKIEVPWRNRWFWGSFTGYIDEVRISTEARYDVEKKGFMPDGKFKNDVKTAALWHFDEPSGTQEFSDASGNAYHLEGKNGARTSIPLAVEAQEKLTTTWGRLKR